VINRLYQYYCYSFVLAIYVWVIPYNNQWRRQGGPAGALAPAVKPCAPAVPRQLRYSDVDHERISWLRATDYFGDVNYDVINHAE